MTDITAQKVKTFFDIFNVDIDKKKNGTWVSIAEYAPVEFKLRTIDTQEWADAVAEAQKPYRVKINKKVPLEVEESKDIITRAMAKAMIADWRGLYDRDGTPVPYSPEVALDILTRERATGLADRLFQAASDTTNYKIEEEQDTEKNLLPTSTGS
jgi:hypothetical protein